MEENLGKIIVSFCIPVYNNALAAEVIVKELLSCEDSRFEVIVCDDNSQENVEELLTKIHDPRFRYYRNEKNLGAHKNWEHTLELGCGEWLYLIMARDRMHGDKIPGLIEILENARKNDIVYLKDGYTQHNGKEIQVFDGMNAMLEFVRIIHPTGDIYDGEKFRNIPNRTRYYENSDMYPENYVKHYLLLSGKGAYIMSYVHVFETFYSSLIDFSKMKSGVESGGNIFNVYFSPKRRMIQNLELIDMIDSDSRETFTQNERDLFFRTRFNNIMDYATRIWQMWCSDYLWMAHYGHAVRYVSSFEMIGNVITAYKSTKAHLLEKGLFTSTRQTIMRVNCGKAIAKCILYYPFKRAVKKIIQTLRLWELLTRIRRKFS